VAAFPVALVRIIIRRQLFQRHKDNEHDANSHTHRCGGYPEDQILRHSLLPARFSRTIARARGEGCPKADVYVFGPHIYIRQAKGDHRCMGWISLIVRRPEDEPDVPEASRTSHYS
jgi:hypothetical protein